MPTPISHYQPTMPQPSAYPTSTNDVLPQLQPILPPTKAPPVQMLIAQYHTESAAGTGYPTEQTAETATTPQLVSCTFPDRPEFDTCVITPALIESIILFLSNSVAFTTSLGHLIQKDKLTGSSHPLFEHPTCRALGTSFFRGVATPLPADFERWSPRPGYEVDCYLYLRHALTYVMQKLASMRIRETELFHGLILLERAISGGLGGVDFSLTAANTPTAIVTCVMIAHKMRADLCWSLKMFADYLCIPLQHLIVSEQLILNAVAFSADVSAEELKTARGAIDRFSQVQSEVRATHTTPTM